MGRPPGSKNRPKTPDKEMVPNIGGFYGMDIQEDPQQDDQNGDPDTSEEVVPQQVSQPLDVADRMEPAMTNPVPAIPDTVTIPTKSRWEITVVGPDLYREEPTILETDDDSEVLEWARERIRMGIVQKIPEGYFIEPTSIKQIYVKRISK